MSYHQIEGLGALKCVRTVPDRYGNKQCAEYQCDGPGEVLSHTKSGYACAKPSGSSTVLPAIPVSVSVSASGSASVSASASASGSGSASTSSSGGSSSYTTATAADTLAKPSASVFSPVLTQPATTSQPTTTRTMPTFTRKSASTNWAPWLFAAVGIGALFFVWRRRS